MNVTGLATQCLHVISYFYQTTQLSYFDIHAELKYMHIL